MTLTVAPVATDLGRASIPNHVAPSLSALDHRIIAYVPEGGNWKSIPADVPSERLSQIRRSFAAGEGSRSTYYGRLRRDAPAYTINTYFTRPGNGCHIHYEQDRVLTYREAARLQSFPDAFTFVGSRAAVAKQIGNAVPPLLAYQIARRLGPAGMFVDLFAGAGGLSLGFVWAGWEPVLASDIEPVFLATYAANIDPRIVAGDLRDRGVFETLVQTVRASRRPSVPLWVIGGPPCQGFSTAGNRRSMDDERNSLFRSYVEFLLEVQPDGFLFENVMGLLSMSKGAVLDEIVAELSRFSGSVQRWLLKAERYAVPQRRHRVFLLAARSGEPLQAPPAITEMASEAPRLTEGLAAAVTVSDAIADLPSLAAGEDGTMLGYAKPPTNPYQRLMRSGLSPADFIGGLRTPRP